MTSWWSRWWDPCPFLCSVFQLAASPLFLPPVQSLACLLLLASDGRDKAAALPRSSSDCRPSKPCCCCCLTSAIPQVLPDCLIRCSLATCQLAKEGFWPTSAREHYYCCEHRSCSAKFHLR